MSAWTPLGRLLTSPDIPMRLRIAGIIVLLYAQPLTRVVRLTIDDVLHDGETALLRLGGTGLTHPRAGRLPAPGTHRRPRQHAIATNPASRWLFPGRRPGQPCRPDHLSALLGKVGVPAAAARGAAIRQQLLEMPAPSSPTLWATTTRPPPVSSTRPAVNGADTPPGITQSHHYALQHPQLATVEYASPPGPSPVSSLVTGNGTYTMAVTDNNTTQRYFSSKESSGKQPPQLVVTWTAP